MNMRANTVTGLAGVRTNPNQCRMTTFVLASLILVQIALGAESTKVWEENARAVANGVGEFRGPLLQANRDRSMCSKRCTPRDEGNFKLR